MVLVGCEKKNLYTTFYFFFTQNCLSQVFVLTTKMKTLSSDLRSIKKKIQNLKQKLHLIFHREKCSYSKLPVDELELAPIPPLIFTPTPSTNDSEEWGEFTSREPPSTIFTPYQTIPEAEEEPPCDLPPLEHAGTQQDVPASAYATIEVTPKRIFRTAITHAKDEHVAEETLRSAGCDGAYHQEMPKPDYDANASGSQVPYCENIIMVNPDTMIVGLTLDDLVNIGIQTVVNGYLHAGPHHYPHCPLSYYCHCYPQQGQGPSECGPPPEGLQMPEKRIVSVHLVPPEPELANLGSNENLTVNIKNPDNKLWPTEVKRYRSPWRLSQKLRLKGRIPLQVLSH